MVIISIKQKDGDGFLYETTTDTPNTELISSLVTIHNLRVQAQSLIPAVRGLALHGPMHKTPQEPSSSSLQTEQVSYDADRDNVNENYKPDPTGLRNGNPPTPKLAETLFTTIQELEDYIDKSQVQRRIALEKSVMDQKLQNVNGAITMAYPMGLPDWDVITHYTQSFETLPNTLIAEETSLWAAGKEFVRDQCISDRLGSNEKQKVIAKLQHKDEGPPGREPLVSEQERKAMMAHYFKRQEQLKQLNEVDQEDDYLNSAWADPKEMKRGLQGVSTIRAPGLKF